MAKSKKAAVGSPGPVTQERAKRLYRLLLLLGQGPQLRTSLTRKLRLGVRGFYRDLEVLRLVGVTVELNNSRYQLKADPAEAIELLPFPDPGLTLGEARILARGRSLGHKKIRGQLQAIER